MSKAERLDIIRDAKSASARGHHALAAALFSLVGISYIGGGEVAMVKKEKPHDERIELRVPTEDADRWRATADAVGLNLSEWLRHLANENSLDPEMIALVKAMNVARKKAIKSGAPMPSAVDIERKGRP